MPLLEIRAVPLLENSQNQRALPLLGMFVLPVPLESINDIKPTTSVADNPAKTNAFVVIGSALGAPTFVAKNAGEREKHANEKRTRKNTNVHECA